MIKDKFGFLAWIVVIGIVVVVTYKQSATPYQQQDIKPFLREHIKLTADSLPHVAFIYDGETVTTRRPYDFVEFWIRKFGHVLEYAIITACLLRLLSTLAVARKWVYGISFLVALSYAALDEWHQTFVPGRTGHAIDVFTFDLFGILLALLFATLFTGFRPPLGRGGRQAGKMTFR
jgi:VanZ family protein